jgi:hypothetical protein
MAKIADKIGLGKQYKGQKGAPTETTGQKMWKFYQRMKAKMAEGDKNG